MLEALRQLIRQYRGTGTRADRGPVDQNELQLAACALLLELAEADGEFSVEERSHIEAALGRHFNLGSAEVHELIGLAEQERRRAIDHFQHTRVLREQLDLGQRVVLAEVMWGVVLADGRVGDHEGYLLRKLGSLLDLAPGYLASARKTAMDGGTARPERGPSTPTD